MKQVLVSMRPKDGDALSRLDRTGTGAGTSSAGERGGGEEDWGRRGRATVFVSVRRVEGGGWRAWPGQSSSTSSRSCVLLTCSPPLCFFPDKEELKGGGQQLFCPCGASKLSSGTAAAFIVKGGSRSRCSARQQRSPFHRNSSPLAALCFGGSVCGYLHMVLQAGGWRWLQINSSGGSAAPETHQPRLLRL